MDEKTFWKKFTELAEEEREKKRINRLGFIGRFKFEEFLRVHFLTFRIPFGFTKEQIEQKITKINHFAKKYEVEYDTIEYEDREGIIAGFDYDHRFLNELNFLFRISYIEFILSMKAK